MRKKWNTQVKICIYVFPFYAAESEFNHATKQNFTILICFAMNSTVPAQAEGPLGHELSDKGAESA